MKRTEPMWARFARFFITEIKITVDRFERPFRPFGHLFWCALSRESRSSRSATSRSPPSGDLDAFLTLFSAPGTWSGLGNIGSCELHQQTLRLDHSVLRKF